MAVSASAAVLVPEASVDKNDLLETGKNQVWLPRQSVPVQPEAVTQSVGQAANSQFRLGILRPDGAHNSPAAFGGRKVSTNNNCISTGCSQDLPILVAGHTAAAANNSCSTSLRQKAQRLHQA